MDEGRDLSPQGEDPAFLACVVFDVAHGWVFALPGRKIDCGLDLNFENFVFGLPLLSPFRIFE